MAEGLPYGRLAEEENACGPDTPDMIRIYTEAGYDILFCHARDFGAYIREMASTYPDVVFMWGNGTEKIASNTGTCHGRMYEAKFLVRIIAGTMTTSGSIGYVGGLPII